MPYLFVYGSLHPDRAPEEIRSAVKRFVPVSKAVANGTLHGPGPYPGIILNATAPEVPGNVFALPEDPELLRDIDAYEEFYPDRPADSVFLREQTAVLLPDGSQLMAWIYVLNPTLAEPHEP